MQTVDIEKLPETKRKKLFSGLSDLINEVLKKEFDYRDIKTYEDAVAAEPVSEDDRIFEYDQNWVVALKKLRHITKVINGPSVVFNWSDRNQPKWRPWFDLSSGFGFDASTYDYSRTYPGVGSRLCFETEEKSDYAAKQFIDLYKIATVN
jgi:hypothetical protein